MYRNERVRILLYGLFAASGFAGLIYESIWSQYLKLFLGHAAYAQTLVLVIFMGGMAIGSALAGRYSARLKRPLRLYAMTEAALSLLALAFDPAFRGFQALMYGHVLPHIDSPVSADLVKWVASATLILPQTILLGMTFPLMSAAVVRRDPGQSGRALGWLYFTNSLGASVGVLVSGFYLVATRGLPGTLAAGALINALLAICVFVLTRQAGEYPGPRPAPAAAAMPRAPARSLLTVAFLTGTASFFYEIGWIRMLSLVLGSATHSFELMLSAFILGIALGSYFIRGRIGAARDTWRTLGWIQVAMGSTAFVSVALYLKSFDWMSFIIAALHNSTQGYLLFNVLSHAVCMALMLPVTFLAGMTLPLITARLLDAGHGEASIGRVYALNTLGSICGVVLAVHLVLPLLGLRQVVITGAFIDLGLGLWLLSRSRLEPRVPARLGIAAAAVVAVLVTSFVNLDPRLLASGVFRFGDTWTPAGATVLFQRDGKTSSVTVLEKADHTQYIMTNGKTDASVSHGPVPSSDDYTQQLLAILPMMALPHATDVAVVGIGSGRTTHTLLANPRLRSVDTIEIEPMMAAGARTFGALTRRTFDDPRSHIHFEDARTWFARTHRRYDVIAAEPSNPWVSGVSSLFSVEFYRHVRTNLKPGGLFVQWLQLYEINEPLVSSIMNALGRSFSDYRIFAANNGDLIVVASPDGAVPVLQDWVFQEPAIAGVLASIQIRNLGDTLARRLGDKRELAPLFHSITPVENSDYYPVVDQYAVRERFLHSRASELRDLMRVSARLEGLGPPTSPISAARQPTEVALMHDAQLLAATLQGRQPGDQLPGHAALEVIAGISVLDQRCDQDWLKSVWKPAFEKLVRDYLPYMSPADTRAIAAAQVASRCYAAAPPFVHQWIELFAAAGTGRWQSAADAGDALLDANAGDSGLVRVVTREVLLADLRTGAVDRAHETLSRLGARVPSNPAVRMLEANLAAPQRWTVGP